MLHDLLFYLKRYWLVLVLIAVLVLSALFIYFSFSSNLQYIWDKFSNKLEASESIVETVKKEPYDLSMLDVPYTYVRDDYVPSSYIQTDSISEYQAGLKKDSKFMYKLHITWSNYTLSQDDLNQLLELIGYDVNQHNPKGVYTLVIAPGPEDYDKYEYPVVFYMSEDNVTLFVNVKLEHRDKKDDKTVTYEYKTYKVIYDNQGYITFI